MLCIVSQLYMLRTMLEGLLHRTKKNKEKIDTAAVEQIERFLADSFFWNYMINFSSTCTAVYFV